MKELIDKQDEYYICNSILDDYCNNFLKNDIKTYEKKHHFKLHLTDNDIEDIQSDLKVTVLYAVCDDEKIKKKKLSANHALKPNSINKKTKKVRKKAKPRTAIQNYKNYVITIAKNRLNNYLNTFGNENKNKNTFEKEFMKKLADERNRKQFTLGMYLDELPYSEVKEILFNNLTIRQNSILHLVHSKYSFEEIAKDYKITVDSVKRIYRETERILIKVLMKK